MASPASCPEPFLLKQLLQETLPTEQQAELNQHLEGCEHCQKTLEGLVAGKESWSELANHLGRGQPGAQPDAAGEAGVLTAPAEGQELTLDFLAPAEKPGLLGRLGHYEVQEVVGHGGMGIVLRAFDEQLHRVVAIKVMAVQLATSGTARQRFTREARAAAAVSHDHIVTIHGVEETNGLPYLVMQYIAGLSLQQRIDRDGPLQLAEIIRIGMQTAAGLEAAHAQGLVHRDIKPANILLENGVERVKITDFGLARAAADASLTQSGVVAGTPQYMSPEQAEGKHLDQRSDLFSLGSVMYIMCTGRAPFRASGSMAVLKRVCEETPRPIREVNPDIPDWLVAIIDKLHAKDPADRYQTAAEVADLLNQQLAHLQHPSVVPLPVTKPAKAPSVRWSRPVVAAALILCLAAGALGLTVALNHFFTPEDTPVGNNGPEGKGPAGKADPTPFVVLGGEGAAERTFDTLAEAVQGAGDGDTIEIRGNGPFITPLVDLGRNKLTIRAGSNFHPVIRALPGERTTHVNLLRTDAALTLEGIEFQMTDDPPPDAEHWQKMIYSNGAPLYVANCKFLYRATICIGADLSPVCIIRNCEFNTAGAMALFWVMSDDGNCSLENCTLIRTHAVQGASNYSDVRKATIHLKSNTIVGATHSITALNLFAMPDVALVPAPPVQLVASNNIFDSNSVFALDEHPAANTKPMPHDEAENYLRRLVKWREHRNLYAPGASTVKWWVNLQPVSPHGPKTLAEWNEFWRLDKSESIEGHIGYQGSNLLSRHAAASDKVTPADFRLLPDSAGYKAGKNRKDLGADVDLVGPGEAYERWKQTPAYQQWLKDSGQLRAEAPKPEPKAFVVLTSKGVEVRKFDTLTEAVQGASAGDTIEIRGNGPFVSDGVTIGQPLVIRAGEGYTPTITLSQAAADKNIALLTTSAALVLEGLELRRIGGAKGQVENRGPTLLRTSGKGALHVSNCRFVLKTDGPGGGQVIVSDSPVCTIRNCQFSSDTGLRAVAWQCPPGGRGTIENCVRATGSLMDLFLRGPKVTDVVAEIRGNTTVGRCLVVDFNQVQKPAGDPPIRLNFSANVTHCIAATSVLLQVHQVNLEPSLSAPDAEDLLRALVALKEQHNVYMVGTRMLHHSIISKTDTTYLAASQGKDLAAWNQFWKQTDTGSVEGDVHFQGGDLLQRAQTAPENLTADDFRLRPDSAGYKAGKDGKDLGADVDLVGPGAAYERWKQTPEYQEWLKEIKQAKKVAASNPEPKAAPAKTEDDAAKEELARWQGEWENEKGEKLTIKGDQWGWSSVNQTPDPAGMLPLKVVEVTDKMTHVLLLNKKHDGKVHTCQVIFKLDGDTLHYCGTSKAARPTEFATSPGYLYMAWKRPAKQDKAAAAKELEKLQGKWSLVSSEKDGKQVKGEDPDHTFTVKENHWSVHQSGQLVQAGTVERIDVKEKHAVIYIVDTNGEWGVNIFRIEGDALKWLLTNDNRVTEFATTPGDSWRYLIFRRVKP